MADLLFVPSTVAESELWSTVAHTVLLCHIPLSHITTYLTIWDEPHHCGQHKLRDAYPLSCDTFCLTNSNHPKIECRGNLATPDDANATVPRSFALSLWEHPPNQDAQLCFFQYNIRHLRRHYLECGKCVLAVCTTRRRWRRNLNDRDGEVDDDESVEAG